MKWFSLPAVVFVLAAASAHADPFSQAEFALRQDAQLNFPEAVDRDAGDVTIEQASLGGGPAVQQNSFEGYPFVRGCCEPRSHCCNNVWQGYHGARKCHHLNWFHQCGAHCGQCGLCQPAWPRAHGWGKGGSCEPTCHSSAPVYYYGQKHMSYGKGYDHGSKCDSCGPTWHRPLKGGHAGRGKLGLFDWNRGKGHHGCVQGCYDHHAGCCGSDGGTKVIYGKETETHTEGHPVPDPPPVPESGNSAWLRSPASVEF